MQYFATSQTSNLESFSASITTMLVSKFNRIEFFQIFGKIVRCPTFINSFNWNFVPSIFLPLSIICFCYNFHNNLSRDVGGTRTHGGILSYGFADRYLRRSVTTSKNSDGDRNRTCIFPLAEECNPNEHCFRTKFTETSLTC